TRDTPLCPACRAHSVLSFGAERTGHGAQSSSKPELGSALVTVLFICRIVRNAYLSAMNPMSTFNPDIRCRVHDRLNDRLIDWQTVWAPHYRMRAVLLNDDGVIEWDGSLLDGWMPSELQRLQ